MVFFPSDDLRSLNTEPVLSIRNALTSKKASEAHNGEKNRAYGVFMRFKKV
jgi:hypothetical protein